MNKYSYKGEIITASSKEAAIKVIAEGELTLDFLKESLKHFKASVSIYENNFKTTEYFVISKSINTSLSGNLYLCFRVTPDRHIFFSINTKGRPIRGIGEKKFKFKNNSELITFIRSRLLIFGEDFKQYANKLEQSVKSLYTK